MPTSPTCTVLAISGSLRAASSNSAILRIASRIAPSGMTVDIYDEIGALPFFNPDLDRELSDPGLPAEVQALRASVGGHDALLISSPEYAHGVPGVLKNALDWLVGGPEMVNRPVLLLNTSPHSTHAHASLAETLRTMSARVLTVPPIELPRSGKLDDTLALAADPVVAEQLADALSQLMELTSVGR